MSKKTNETLIKNGKRLDGRKLTDLRPLKMEVGVLSRADGSAFVEHGRNKVLAAVYGPREIHPRHLAIPDRSRLRVMYRMASFSVDERKHPAPSRREIELSKVITEAITPSLFLEHFPRTGIDVYVLVIQADGGTRTASINAAVLALADAGLPMRDLVVACAVGKIDGKVALDLDNIEDQKGEADLPIAMMSRQKLITLIQMDGSMSAKEIEQAFKMFQDGAKKISETQRNALKAKFSHVREDVLKRSSENAKEEKK